MKITEKEYLFLSMFVYLNIGENQEGKTAKEIFENLGNKIQGGLYFKNLTPDHTEMFLKYFSEELDEWKLFHVEDKRATTKKFLSSSSRTGFFSASFKKEEKIVIAFRGSETFPFEEAYKDFVENNLVLGLGKKPIQFNDAFEVYEKHLQELEVQKEKISITGHSLGGGLAQYVAISSSKKYEYIPKTVTWNAVGINRTGMILLEDFIDYAKLLKDNFSDEEILVKELENFKTNYFNILNDFSLKKRETIFQIFEKNTKTNTALTGILEKTNKELDEKLELKNKITNVFFKNLKILEEVEKAKNFLKDIDENTIYMGRVKNYGHSKDFTNGIYNHVGSFYDVDLNMKTRKKEIKNIMKTIFSRNSSMMNYHFENVFIPFLNLEGDKKGSLSQYLELDYVVSGIRQMIYKEDGFRKTFLADYFSNIVVDEENFIRIKKDILDGMKKSHVEIIYKKEMLECVDSLEIENFSELWEKLKKKLPSPYRLQDIYDGLLY
ncbi:MAG: lipase family protein [Fusobacteriaceae bacterium]